MSTFVFGNDKWKPRTEIHNHPCCHKQANQETPTTKDGQAEFAAMTRKEERGVCVNCSSHQCLQSHKLKRSVGQSKIADVNLLSDELVTGKMCIGLLLIDFFFALTSLSSPSRIIITKKQMAHSCGTGIIATALGYAMKAKPGPGKTKFS